MKTTFRWAVVAGCLAMAMSFAYLASAAGDAPKAPEGKADTQVVIGKAGKKYHVEGCKQLNDTATKITLGDAVVKGYTPCGSCNPPVLMVYVTKTGKSYHNDGCAALGTSKIAMTFADAIAKGYEPCKRCNPPAMPKADTKPADKPATSDKK